MGSFVWESELIRRPFQALFIFTDVVIVIAGRRTSLERNRHINLGAADRAPLFLAICRT